MTTPIQATDWGLANPLSFTDTDGQTILAGRNTLVTITGGPEGVLLKRIRNFSDAVDCGGVLLYQADDPSRWQWYIGETLIEMMKLKKLGRRSRMISGSDRIGDSAYPVANNRKKGSVVVTRLGADDKPIVKRRKEIYGGDIWPRLIEDNYFPDGRKVIALGVVTTATEGYGISKVGTDFPGNWSAPRAEYPDGGLAYMATKVAIGKTFSEYMGKVKAAALARTPNEARSYYSGTYDAVLAVFRDKDTQPFLTINTYWLNGALIDNIVARPVTHEFEPLYGSSVPPGAGLGLNMASFPSSDGVLDDGPGQETVTVKNQIVRVMIIPGVWYQQDEFPVPFMDFFSNYCAFERVPNMTGVVSGLKVGELRDAHVMLRSLGVNQERFASDPPGHADLAALVKSQLFDPFDGMDDSISSITGELGYLDEATQKPHVNTPADTQNGTGVPATPTAGVISYADQLQDWYGRLRKVRNVYSRANLPILLEDFSAAWDAAARAKAGV